MFHLVSFWLVLGEPNIYHQSVCFTMCGGNYDIVVFFDLVVLWGVFVLGGGYLEVSLTL